MASERIQPKYPGRPPKLIATNPFERALRSLLGRPTEASVMALLGNRVSYVTVRTWRCGARRPASWATTIVARALAIQARELQANLAKEAAPGRQSASIHALMAYRVHRAAQKEKARE